MSYSNRLNGCGCKSTTTSSSQTSSTLINKRITKIVSSCSGSDELIVMYTNGTFEVISKDVICPSVCEPTETRIKAIEERLNTLETTLENVEQIQDLDENTGLYAIVK